MLDFFTIKKIGDDIERELITHDVKENNVLTIIVDEDHLHKIDEDIYYRQFPDGNDFKPSKNEITINFKHLVIKIKSKK